MTFQPSNTRALTLDLACPTCGARIGELCSDVAVFVRADALTSLPAQPPRKPPIDEVS